MLYPILCHMLHADQYASVQITLAIIFVQNILNPFAPCKRSNGGANANHMVILFGNVDNEIRFATMHLWYTIVLFGFSLFFSSTMMLPRISH